jgi:hypothetical protein
VRPDVSCNFNETVVGGIITNTWLYIEGLDRKKGDTSFLKKKKS